MRPRTSGRPNSCGQATRRATPRKNQARLRRGQIRSVWASMKDEARGKTNKQKTKQENSAAGTAPRRGRGRSKASKQRNVSSERAHRSRIPETNSLCRARCQVRGPQPLEIPPPAGALQSKTWVRGGKSPPQWGWSEQDSRPESEWASKRLQRRRRPQGEPGGAFSKGNRNFGRGPPGAKDFENTTRTASQVLNACALLGSGRRSRSPGRVRAEEGGSRNPT